MENFIGEFAALGAALAFGFTSTSFTLAGRKIGAISSLAFSLPISMVILIGLHIVMVGDIFPFSAGLDRWFYLTVSGVFGFVISSIFILRAFQYIGPRLTLLVASFAPILSAIIAWVFLGQELPNNAIWGIALVLTGIVWVVTEGDNDAKRKVEADNTDYRKGLIFAVGGALGQAIAIVFSSQGVSGDFPAMSASLMRTFVAVVTIWLFIMSQGNVRRNLRLIIAESYSMRFIMIAAVSGPVIGASLVLLSLQFTTVGVSSTLTNTTPIILIPIGYFVFKEKITARAIVGTMIAIAGIAVLFT